MLSVYDETPQNFKSWVFTPPISKGSSGKIVYIHCDETKKSHPRIQLCRDGDPPLLCPFGMTSFSGEATTTSSARLTLDLSVTHDPLLEFLKAFDVLIQDVAYNYCKEWFNKELSREQIASLYRPCLTQKSDSFPAALRTKVALKGSGGRPTTILKVIKSSSGIMTYARGTSEDIKRGCEVWASVDVMSIYFMSNMFGCTLTVSDLLVFPPRLPDFPFITSMNLIVHSQKREEDDASTT